MPGHVRGRLAPVVQVAEGLSRTALLTLVTQFVLNGSTAMVVPFLAVYLSQRQHVSPAATGTVLTSYLLSVRLLPALTGGLADRLGARFLVAAGCVVRAAGLAAFPLLGAWPAMVAGAAVIGLGGALAEPALRAVLAREPERARASAFAIRNQALNGSYVLGAGLGGVLAAVDVAAPFLVSAVCLAALAALALANLPARAGPREPGLTVHYRTAFRNRQFVLFWLAMIPWWVLYTQLNLAFPLYAFQLTGDETRVGLLFAVSGIVGVPIMWPAARLYRTWPALRGVMLGLGCLVASFALVPALPSYLWFLACVVLFTVAETLVLVGSDLHIAGFTSRLTVATYYGLYTTAWAVGGTIGNYLGPWFASTRGGVSGWLVFAAIGAVGLAGVGLLRRRGDPEPEAERPTA
jgi:predicted MFS family arabinose efflux permease